jgi:hypothetical protein
MAKFLDIHESLKLNWDDINNLSDL